MILSTVFALALISSGQTPPQSASTPAPAVASSQAGGTNAEAPAFSTNLPIETLMANPAAREAVLDVFPGIDENPLYEALKVRSFRQIAPMSQGTITPAQLDKLDEALRAIKP